MGNPVVHVEVVGPDPGRLRAFCSALFGWDAPPGAPVASEVSDVESCSFIVPPDGASAPAGGIGGGSGFAARVVVYVGVPDVEAALVEVERLGGARVLGPIRNEGGGVTVGRFTDPAATLLGAAGPV